MQFNKWIVGIVILLLAIGLGFLGGIYVKKPVTINNPVPIYIPGNTVKTIEKHYYPVHDTLKAEVKNDTAKTTFYNTKVFEDGDTIKVKSEVGYTLSDSTFSLEQYVDFIKVKTFQVDTVKIEVPTQVFIEKDIPFYETSYFGYVTGIITVLLIILGIKI